MGIGMKILITGASGLLGKKVFSKARHKYDVVGTCFRNRAFDVLLRFDLSDLKEIGAFLDLHKPDLIIHTAALTNVDLAEQRAPLAKIINADATLEIAHWCERNDARLIYVSSDYVFDGERGPYDEFDTPYPIQIYGFTKLLGEAVLREHSTGAVVRIGILHGFNDLSDKPTVTSKVVHALKLGQMLTLDHERVKYPTLIDDVAEGLLQIAEHEMCGIFHFAGSEGVTRYEWALRVADVFELDGSLLVADLEKRRDVLPRRPRDVKLLNTRTHFQHHNLDDILILVRQQMKEAGAL